MADENKQQDAPAAPDTGTAVVLAKGSISPVTIYADTNSFEIAQRFANSLIRATTIPKDFQGNLGNIMTAMEYANRLKISPLMVMQNMNIIHGKPGWGSTFLISLINSSGKYAEDLQYEMFGDKGTPGRGCIAFTIGKNGKRVEGAEFTVQMAIDMGLYGKEGSKWKTMPEMMLRYRAAAYFSRLNCPEITLGMQTSEELHDEPYANAEVLSTTVHNQPGQAADAPQTNFIDNINAAPAPDGGAPPVITVLTPEVKTPAATDKPEKKIRKKKGEEKQPDIFTDAPKVEAAPEPGMLPEDEPGQDTATPEDAPEPEDDDDLL